MRPIKISINFKRKTVPTKEQFERKTNQTPPVQCTYRKNNWCYYYYAQRFHPSVGLNWLDRCLDKRHEIQEKINNKNAATLWELWTWTELKYNLHFLYWSLWNDKCWFSTFCIRIEEVVLLFSKICWKELQNDRRQEANIYVAVRL